MNWFERMKHGHFSPTHDLGLNDPGGDRLDERLMELLDEARDEAGVPFIATSGYRPPARNAAAGGAVDSAHLPDERGIARAVDGYFEGWSLLEQFVHLVRFPFFAVAAYPYPPPGRDPAKLWMPVIHVDRKDRDKRFGAKVLWVRNAAGVYVYWPSEEFKTELRRLAHPTEVHV